MYCKLKKYISLQVVQIWYYKKDKYRIVITVGIVL